jgi:hypothetical protein
MVPVAALAEAVRMQRSLIMLAAITVVEVAVELPVLVEMVVMAARVLS